jgi:hypothetical protein
MLHRREKRILHCIVRVRHLAEHGKRDRVRRTDVALHEQLEGLRVAVLRTDDERGIGVLLCLVGGRSRSHSVMNAGAPVGV